MNSQDIILTALENEVEHAVSQFRLEESVLDNVPRSHVFYPEPGEPWDEDDVAAIRAVGNGDVLNKINYYSRVLDELYVRELAERQGDQDDEYYFQVDSDVAHVDELRSR